MARSAVEAASQRGSPRQARPRLGPRAAAVGLPRRNARPPVRRNTTPQALRVAQTRFRMPREARRAASWRRKLPGMFRRVPAVLTTGDSMTTLREPMHRISLRRLLAVLALSGSPGVAAATPPTPWGHAPSSTRTSRSIASTSMPNDAAAMLGRQLAHTLGEQQSARRDTPRVDVGADADALRRIAIAHALEWAFPLVGDDIVLDHLSHDANPKVRGERRTRGLGAPSDARHLGRRPALRQSGSRRACNRPPSRPRVRRASEASGVCRCWVGLPRRPSFARTSWDGTIADVRAWLV